MLHERFLEAGTRLLAISIDSPERNAAMVEKLLLPFAYLSDPDRTAVIGPYGLADPKDVRNIALPAVVLVTPAAEEAFRFVSRDFAERLPEEKILDQAVNLGLPPTTQARPLTANSQPGPRSLSAEQLRIYYRGARFAALAMGLRHAHFSDEIKNDSKAYVAEMDRYTAAIEQLMSRPPHSM